MKKLLILVACFAFVLVLSHLNFAQEEESMGPVSPCTCPHCTAALAPLPFAYTPCPAPKVFGTRLATFAARHTLPFGTPYPGVPMGGAVAAPYPEMPMGPVAAPYPYGVSDLKHRAIRRAARLAPRPQPYPVPVPVAVVAPPALPAPDSVAPGYAPVVQTGRKNFQRNGDAPVINFMSIVRNPQPYGGYYYPIPAPPHP